MKASKMYVPQNLQELLEFVVSMLSSAPKFTDKTGYFPYQDLDYVFQQLTSGFNNIRQALGEERYNELLRMSERMRALFESDPEDKTGETLAGCKIIHRMEDILRQVQRKV